MRKVRVRTIAQTALESLRRSDQWEVHSVFDRAFNITAGDNLVGVSRADVPMNPINLVTDITSGTMQSLGIEKGLAVVFRGDALEVGNVLEISFSGAPVWKPRMRVENPLPLEIVRRNLEAAKKVASDAAKADGLGRLLEHLNEICGGVERIDGLDDIAKKALPALARFVEGVRVQNFTMVKSATEKLIGLGSGLTPSADDFLSGFSCSLGWMCRSYGKGLDFLEKLNGNILGQLGKTNLLSRKLLEHAVVGETHEYAEDFLETMLHGHVSDLGPVTRRVLEIGETSGVDMMVGLLLGVMAGVNVVG